MLIGLFCAVDGVTQFGLNFVHSTNKVIVTDYYYMLEYSIVRGSSIGSARDCTKFLIK